MGFFNIFNISGSGMSAESVRLDTVASNLANADSVSSTAADAYKARYPVFQAVQAAISGSGSPAMQGADASVAVNGIVQSTAPPTARYEPGNPMANAQGYVFSSNVNVVQQMVDMISASRSYQNDAQVLNTSKTLMVDTLKLAQI